MKRTTFGGACLCGEIEVQVTGAPLTQGICHCESCRRWHAAPVNAWALWRSKDVSIVRGEELLNRYDTGTSCRHWCGRCGAGMFNRKSKGLTVVYAVVLEKSGYIHQPSCHIHCDESVFDVDDGLPKYRDLPVTWGGSGERMDGPEERLGSRP